MTRQIAYPPEPKIDAESLVQIDTLYQLAELALRNTSDFHSPKGLRTRTFPVPSLEGEDIEVYLYRPDMLRIEEWGRADGSEKKHIKSKLIVNPMGKWTDTYYWGSGEYSTPRRYPDSPYNRNEVFTPETAQRLIDKIAEAAQLSPRTDETVK